MGRLTHSKAGATHVRMVRKKQGVSSGWGVSHVTLVSYHK